MNDENNQEPVPNFKINAVERALLLEIVYFDSEVDDIESVIAAAFRDPDEFDIADWLPGLDEDDSAKNWNEERDRTPPQDPADWWKDVDEEEEIDFGSDDDQDQDVMEGPELSSLDEDSSDHLPGLDVLWKMRGIEGFLVEYAVEYIVKITNYGLRNWYNIQTWIEELELTPLPNQAEIEKVCGKEGLNMPTLKLGGSTYFDFLYLHVSAEEKRKRQADYDQVRELVGWYLL